MQEIILRKICPNGSVQGLDEYFVYQGDIKTIRRLDKSHIPITDGYVDSGEKYTFRREQGWLIEFRLFSFQTVQWAVFYNDDDVIIDTGKDKLLCEQDELFFHVSIISFFARIKISSNKSRRQAAVKFAFPILSSFFINDDRDHYQCHAGTHVFQDFTRKSAYIRWKSNWRRGIFCPNDSIHFPENIVWRSAEV